MAISRLSETTLQTGFQKFNTAWDGRSGVGAFEPIGSWTAWNDNVQSITFSNIPATYQHLQVRGMTIGTAGQQDVLIRFNNISATNYNWHEMRGTGSGGLNFSNAGTGATLGYVASNSTDDTMPTPFVVDIADYSTGKFKAFTSLSGTSRSSTTGTVSMFGGLFTLNQAITSVTVFTTGAYYFFAGSKISLYGIK